MEQFEGIRRDHRDEGLSIRQLATKYQVHRRTVRSALVDAVPPVRKVAERAAPVLGPYEEVVRGWLTADLAAPRKQRHTARRVWQRLLEEQDASVAESSVRAMVAVLKVQVGLTRREVMVPQSHPPAEEAEVDFGEFQAVIAGVVMRVWMFCLRLSHSGRAVHIAYANQAQESFLDGHVRAFERLGGVPTGMIRYDNLKPAVIRVALGRERFEHPRFVALRSHYGYDSFYCIPGIDGAHEKGGVEGEIGRFRRRHLTPVPHLPSMAALNAALAAADVRDETRRIGSRTETVGAAGARETLLLNALPDNDFDVALALSCRVDAKARVCVRQSFYSVPARYAGMRVQVRLGADTVTVLDHATSPTSVGSSSLGSGGVVATHTRSLHKGSEDLILDHYLEVLTRKPGALAGATALASARAAGTFTTAHQRFWDGARKTLGDSAGTRALVGLLLLHRTLPAAALTEAMTSCTAAGQYDPDIVAVTARHTIARAATSAPGLSPVPLPPHAPGAAGATRKAPSLAGYDDLLTHPMTGVTSPVTSPVALKIGASS
ncbi:IS21 family transposase [Lapillicoccus sp.]|uniref:IS21 family transposase n=1 Tax=Lapillicoccus sp. TaxID=1909287 RepID=UPI0025D2DAEF|nr:IS21 family transposase [Lapillicoccus sp.]